jgi:HEAT repeat protein
VKDVRATAATALGDTGSPAAVPFLRERLLVEPDPQVRIALSAAIRALTQPPGLPKGV